MTEINFPESMSVGSDCSISRPVNFKPDVIRWPKVANVLVVTILRGDTALWEVRQCWSCLGLQSDWMCTTFHAKINDLLWYCLRWNVKQPGEVCVGGRNTRFKLIITCVYSWNTQKQESQLNLMKMKVPLGSYKHLSKSSGLNICCLSIIFKRTHVSRKVWGMEQDTSSDMKEKPCALNLALSLKCPRELTI